MCELEACGSLCDNLQNLSAPNQLLNLNRVNSNLIFLLFLSEVEYWMISDNLNNNVADKSSNFGGNLKPDTWASALIIQNPSYNNSKFRYSSTDFIASL